MPHTLHPIIRYRVIDRCLQQRNRKWTWKELSEACGDELREKVHPGIADPSERAIKGDIAVMRGGKLGYHAPIEWDARAGTYRYDDPGYTITRVPLTDEHLRELRHALAILRQYRGLRQAAGLDDVLTRLENVLRRQRPRERVLVQLDVNEQLAGLHWLGPLHDALDREQCLLLDYHPFYEPAPGRRRVSPYLLREYNNRWFLVGWDHEARAVHNHALDRITGVEADLLTPFYRAPHFDAATYFRDVVGVTLPVGAAVEEVVLRVDAAQAPYLVTKPLHASQQELARDTAGVTFAYRVIPNYELESRILALGEAAEVLAPATLRERLRERVRGMMGRYGGGG